MQWCWCISNVIKGFCSLHYPNFLKRHAVLLTTGLSVGHVTMDGMADVFGVDFDEKRPLVPFVITGSSLSASVVRDAEMARKIAARREWRERKARGEVPEDASPPPGPDSWELAAGPVTAGVAVGVVLGLLVQVIGSLLGRLFGFDPGSIGLWVGLLGGLLAGTAVFAWRDSMRRRAAEELDANQRVISVAVDKGQIVQAHTAAMTVSKLWPHLPVKTGSPEPRLRWALWHLSGELLERRKYAETLADLRRNSVGVPASVPVASDVAVRIKHAEAEYQAHDEAAQAWLGCVDALAGACQRLYDAQVAIGRARQAKQRADVAFGTIQVAERPLTEDIGALTAQIGAVMDAYQRLAQDASDT
jgi:hypothetical protein